MKRFTMVLGILGGFAAPVSSFAIMAYVPPKCVEAERHGRVVCGQPQGTCEAHGDYVVCTQVMPLPREYATCAELEKAAAQFLNYGQCGDDPLPIPQAAVGVQFHSYRDCVNKVRALNRVPVSVAPWKAAPGQGRPDLTPRGYCQGVFPYANDVRDSDDLEEEPAEAAGVPSGIPVRPRPAPQISQLQ